MALYMTTRTRGPTYQPPCTHGHSPCLGNVHTHRPCVKRKPPIPPRTRSTHPQPATRHRSRAIEARVAPSTTTDHVARTLPAAGAVHQLTLHHHPRANRARHIKPAWLPGHTHTHMSVATHPSTHVARLNLPTTAGKSTSSLTAADRNSQQENHKRCASLVGTASSWPKDAVPNADHHRSLYIVELLAEAVHSVAAWPCRMSLAFAVW